MASKKELAQIETDKKASVVMRDYLLAANRPYSVTDVHTNLRGEFNKPTVQRVLEQLADAKEIKEKVIGKQKIYYPDQDQMPAADETEMKALDEQIKVEQEKLTAVTANLKKLEAELKAASDTMTMEELTDAVAELEKLVAEKDARLASLESASQPQVSADEVAAVEKSHTRAVQVWRTRKRIATEMLNAVLDNCAKKRKDLINDMGIDTDEDANVKLP